MHEFVRPATAQDLDELSRLIAEHRNALASGARGGEEWLDDHPALERADWERALVHPQTITLVAGVDDAVLGIGTAHLETGRAIIGAQAQGIPLRARIDLIYVTEDAREIGLGEQLVEAIVAWATESGASSIEAEALPGDRLTKNLFERVGMVARLITVSKRLR